MVTSDTRGPIDDAIARQIGQIKWPANEGVLPRNSWKRWGGGELIEALAVQFPWVRETVAVTVARKGLEPVAVLGIAGKAPDRLAEDVLSMLMAATENLARSEELQQTAAMYQWLFGSAKKPVVIVREDGDIVAGTDSGLHLLQVAEFGDGRSPVSSVEQAVPTDIMSDVCCWLVSTKRGISIKGTPFGRGNLDLAEPLIVLELSLLNTKKTNVLLAQPEEALTPAQTDVYRLLIRGLLYKEISQHLHISPHTVHRHVCEILRRLHCSDRVDLLAKTIQKGAAAGPNVPASSDR
jgi:DNA-binding CsgD family transcriptional regulator